MYVVSVFFLMCLLSGCNDSALPMADKQMQVQQEASQREAIRQTGLPGITNFTELKLMKNLYELRDSTLVTYSYIPDMNGKLWHLCDSIGYGLPYGVQYSNPEKHIEGENSNLSYNLPQSEPNGLYMPPTAEGTWVMCADSSKKMGVNPVYVEPRVIVSPFKLRSSGEYAVQ